MPEIHSATKHEIDLDEPVKTKKIGKEKKELYQGLLEKEENNNLKDELNTFSKKNDESVLVINTVIRKISFAFHINSIKILNEYINQIQRNYQQFLGFSNEITLNFQALEKYFYYIEFCKEYENQKKSLIQEFLLTQKENSELLFNFFIETLEIYYAYNHNKPFFEENKENYEEDIIRLDDSTQYLKKKTIEEEQRNKVLFDIENYNYQKKNSFFVNFSKIQFAGFLPLGSLESKNCQISLNCCSMFIRDSLLEKPKIGRPLKLVSGSDELEIKETCNFICKNEFPQQIIIYTQNYGTPFFYKENQKTNKIDFTLFLKSDCAISFKTSIYFQNQTKKIDSKIKLNKLIYRFDLNFYWLFEIQQQLKKIELIKEKQPKVNELEPIKRQKSIIKLDLSLEINNFSIDIFPYYNKTFLKSFPELFDFKTTDLDNSCAKNQFFYENIRSFLTIEKINMTTNINTENPEQITFELKISYLKYYLLKYIDFYVKTNPILLKENKFYLCKFYDTILESMGFVNVLEINNILIVMDYFQKNINASFEVGDTLMYFCQDSLKDITKHLEFIKNVKEFNKINQKEKEKFEKMQKDLDNSSELSNVSLEDLGSNTVSSKKTNEKNVKIEEKIEEKIITNEVKEPVINIDMDTFEDESLVAKELALEKRTSNDFEIVDEAVLEEVEKEEREFQENYKNILEFTNKLHENSPDDPPSKLIVTIVVLTFGVNIYEGSDFMFNFSSTPESRSRKVSIAKEEIENKTDKNFEINKEYISISKLTTNMHEAKFNDYFNYNQKHKKTLRERSKFRESSNYLKFYFENLLFKLNLFAENNKESCEYLARATFSLGNLEILDFLPKSVNRKMLCKDKNVAKYFTNFLNIKFDLFKNYQVSQSNVEVQLQIQLHPIRIYAGAINIDFLINFFEIREKLLLKKDKKKKISNKDLLSSFVLNEKFEENVSEKDIDCFATHKNHFSKLDRSQIKSEVNGSDEMPKNISEYFIRLFYLNEFYVIIDYDAKYSHIIRVFEDPFQIRNIGYIQDLKIEMKQIILQGYSLLDTLKTIAKQIETSLLTQKTNFLRNLPYISNFLNILEKIGLIVMTPFKNIYEGKKVLEGFSEVTVEGFKSVGVEILNISENITHAFEFSIHKFGLLNKTGSKQIHEYIKNARLLVSIIYNIIQIDENELSKKDEKYKK